MIRISKVLVFIVCILLLFTSCWDSQELDQRALVGGIGVDIENGQYKVTCQVIPAEASKAVLGGTTGGDPNLIWDISTEGDTISDALFETKTITGRDPSFSHTRAVLFSQELAEKGLLESLDYFKRNEEIRRRVWIMIAEDDIEEILATENKLNIIPSYGLSEVMVSGPDHTDIAAIDLHEFSKKVTCKSSCAYAPIVYLRETSGKEDEKSSPKDEEESSSKQETSNKRPDVHKTAVFDDYKMVGVLNREETRGLMWLNDLIDVTAVNVQSPGNSSKLINLIVNVLETTIKPEIRNDTYVMKVKVVAGGYISEKHDHTLNTSDHMEMFKIDKELNKVIEEEINMVLEKARSLKTDIFDFGDIINKSYPEEWDKIQEDWKEVFPRVQVEFEFDTKITWSGRIDNNG